MNTASTPKHTLQTSTPTDILEDTLTGTLTLENVSRIFTQKRGFLQETANVLAVNNVNLNLKAHEVVGLVGESGCGKSTLGRMMAGLLPPTSGRILVEGKSLYTDKGKDARAISKGSIQMIFQDPYSSLNPRLPIGTSIAEPLTVQGVPRQERQRRVYTMLELIGFSKEQAMRYPHEFSGGQRQRIAVARALITNPQILICDEPVSALDACVQAQILNLLCDIQERFAPTNIFISHDLAVVGFMCPRIIVMYLGKVVEDAPREILFQNPAHPYTQGLMASIPSLNPEDKILTPPLSGELPSPYAPPQGCAFHPRCSKATDICKEEEPPLICINHEHRVRCHLTL